MGNFNRGSRSGGERSYRPSSFNNRGDRQVEMYQAVCSKCGKNCELPFRPTNSRPVFCSSCFENNRTSDSGSDGRNFDRPSNNFDDREMFTAVCADCGSNCQVPFRPTNGKPVFCSNCFGEKKGAGNREDRPSNSQPQNDKQLELLNSKLDKIIALLTANTVKEAVSEEIVKELSEEQPVKAEKKSKTVKNKTSKKK